MYTLIRDIRRFVPKTINTQNLKNKITIKIRNLNCVITTQETIISLDHNGNINIYSIFTGKHLKTLQNKTESIITKIAAQNDLIVCGFSDGTIGVYSLKNFEKQELRTFMGHDVAIFALAIQNEKNSFC